MTRSEAPIAAATARPLVATCLVWLACLAGGFGCLTVYSQTPGRQERPAEVAPTGSSGEWRLVMAIHPRCPCTTASLAEVGRLLSSTDANVSCEVHVYEPAEAPDGWADTKTTRDARRLPGAVVHTDRGGEAARRYGVLTSGGVVLYDSEGSPRYHGGVTPARNHEGDNLGAQAIRALLRGEPPAVTSRPVYGCAIVSEPPADQRSPS